MKKKTRTEVIIESQTTIVLRHGDSLRGWCARCGCETLMLTPEVAAALAGLTTHVTDARVEEDALHFQELPDGRLLVCGHSAGLNQQITNEAEKGERQ
jgi:hypothetical protein